MPNHAATSSSVACNPDQFLKLGHSCHVELHESVEAFPHFPGCHVFPPYFYTSIINSYLNRVSVLENIEKGSEGKNVRSAGGKTLGKVGKALLLVQPFLAFLVFLSVLTGDPPLWVSWLVVLLPLSFRIYLKERLLPVTRFDLSILVLTAGMILGFIVRPSAYAVTALNTYFAGLLLYYGLVANSRAAKSYWVALGAFLFLVFVSLAVMVFASGVGKQVSFNMWAYKLGHNLHFLNRMNMNSNVPGFVFAVSLPVFLAIAIFPQKLVFRLFAGTAAIISAVFLALSASGGAWISAMFGLLIVILVRGVKVWVPVLGSFAIILLATVGYWIVFHYQNIIERETYWRATVTALAKHPIFGLGLGAWWTTVQTDITPGGPHSTYLQLYSDCGVLGLIALLLMFVALIILVLKILRYRRDSLYFGLGIGLLAGIVVMGGDAFIDNTFVVLTPVGKGFICFTAPFIWVALALFTIAAKNLSGGKR